MARWNRRSDDLEGELRANRPEAPAHFVKSLSLRIGEAAHEQERHGAFRRGLAAAVTVAVFGALASFGGLSYAASGAAHGVKAVKKAVTNGSRTGDIAFGKPSVGTKAMADAVIAQL